MTLKNWFSGPNLPLRLTAFITWILVSYTIVFNAPEFLSADPYYGETEDFTLFDQLHMAFWLLLYYAGTFLGTLGNPYGGIQSRHRIGSLIMGLCLFPIVLFGPKQDEQLILLVILAGVLGYAASLRRTLVVIAILHLAITGIYRWRWYQDFYWPGSLLYFGFCLFAMVSNNIARRESVAREELAVAHKQLLATQQLLTESAIQDERLRISRDLHDALGHHLTALSLQLEVAKKLVIGKALEHVEQAQALSKMLLSDVRQVVADTRRVPGLNIHTSLQQLMESAKGHAELNVQPQLDIKNSRVVETLFRLVQEIITNSNRYSQTGRLVIDLEEADKSWRLQASDGGQKSISIKPGAGIRGMRERVEALRGSFELKTDKGLAYHILLPKHD
jgi:signal transduction histidine kinase